jgi:hypothetical protein
MLAASAGTTSTTCRPVPVATSINPIASLRKRSQKLFRLQTHRAQAGAHPLAQMLKALLLRQKDEAIPKPQNRKGRAVSQPKILAELFGNGELTLLANLGCGQVFELGILRCHDG